MSCPQTEEEILAYFWSVIKKQPGQSANDFESVLVQEYPWNGELVRFTQDAPGPHEQLPPNASFYGITIQAGADGIPAGRIWIPTAVPDANGYFTRYYQVIEDKPGGVHGVDFIWGMRYLEGNPYVPICEEDETPVPPQNVLQRLETLEAQMIIVNQSLSALSDRITALEQGSSGVKFGDKIALVTNSGFIAGIQGGGPTTENAPINLIGKKEAHAWESFELIKGE